MRSGMPHASSPSRAQSTHAHNFSTAQSDIAGVQLKNTLAFVASPQAPLGEEEKEDVREHFCCCEREWFHSEAGGRGDLDVYRTWCTGVPHLVSATPSRRATPQYSQWQQTDWNTTGVGCVTGLSVASLPGPMNPEHPGRKLFL